MTFVEFVQWLAAPAALAILSSTIVQALKRVYPAIADRLAVAVSVAVAAVVSIVAMYALPHLQALPPDVERLWPVLVWAIQQLWYQLYGQRLLMPKREEP